MPTLTSMTKDTRTLAEQFEEDVPSNDELWGSIEWTDDPGESITSSELIESFHHPRTGTKVDIYQSEEGTYSVQAKCGGLNEDAVVQPDDPSRFVSGSTSVLALDETAIGSARTIAFCWLKGWAWRNATTGDSEGDIRDLGEQ